MAPPVPQSPLAARALAFAVAGLLAGSGCGPGDAESMDVGDREAISRQITHPPLPGPAPESGRPARPGR